MSYSTIVATNDTIRQIVKEEIAKYGDNADLNHIDVSKVTNMSQLFAFSPLRRPAHASQHFNGDMSQWDVSNVTNMQGMFRSSHFNGDISKWDVSNVRTMSRMFESSCFNGNIYNWDVSNVTTTWYMFQRSQFNGDISNWTLHGDCDVRYMLHQVKGPPVPPLLRVDAIADYHAKLNDMFGEACKWMNAAHRREGY